MMYRFAIWYTADIFALQIWYNIRSIYTRSVYHPPQRISYQRYITCSKRNGYHWKKHLTLNVKCFFHGAEGETRTLAPVSRPTPLAGAPRHQLEYFCIGNWIRIFNCPQKRWRREWDSNPRYVAVRRFSRPFRYNHFGISAYISLDILSHQNWNVNWFFRNFKFFIAFIHYLPIYIKGFVYSSEKRKYL